MALRPIPKELADATDQLNLTFNNVNKKISELMIELNELQLAYDSDETRAVRNAASHVIAKAMGSK
jgi:hypothetical protein